jgi:hypothetical protein
MPVLPQAYPLSLDDLQITVNINTGTESPNCQAVQHASSHERLTASIWIALAAL